MKYIIYEVMPEVKNRRQKEATKKRKLISYIKFYQRETFLKKNPLCEIILSIAIRKNLRLLKFALR